MRIDYRTLILMFAALAVVFWLFEGTEGPESLELKFSLGSAITLFVQWIRR